MGQGVLPDVTERYYQGKKKDVSTLFITDIQSYLVHFREKKKIKRLNTEMKSKVAVLYCSALLPLHCYNSNTKNN